MRVKVCEYVFQIEKETSMINIQYYIISITMLMNLAPVQLRKCYVCDSTIDKECQADWKEKDLPKFRNFIKECEHEGEICTQKKGKYIFGVFGQFLSVNEFSIN